MRISASRILALTTALAIAAHARPALAQTQAAAPPAMDHGAMDHGKMDHGAMSPDGAWAAMDEFHMLLMKTWHPAKASNDLAPTRTNAAAMATRAEEWAKSPVPAACKNTTKATVARIATDSRALAELVAGKAADAKVKDALAAVHGRFEDVEKGCAKPPTHEMPHTMPAKAPPAGR